MLLIADGFATGRAELEADAIQARTRTLVEAGVPWVSLRDHDADEGTVLEVARPLVRDLRSIRPDVVVSVHGDLRAALDLEVGLHVGRRGASLEDALEAGVPGLVGVSAHSATGAARAGKAGASYATFSPVWTTRTHPDAVPTGIDPLKLAATHARIPVLALGGITPPRARIARLVGAHGAAAISSLLFAWDEDRTVRQFLNAVARGGARPRGRTVRPRRSSTLRSSPRPSSSNPTRMTFTALTIAGSDSGGGAGIQADLKAFEAHGVFGMSVVTALTAQNTREVAGVHAVPADFVTAQLDAVAGDLPIGAVKTGMLATPDIVKAVANGLSHHGLGPIVVDPVMISKSGDALLADDAVASVATLSLPLADVVTPNAHEAARLTGLEVRSLEDARRAGRQILALGPKAVLIKGGHLESETDAVDVLLTADGETLFREERIDTPNTHGTGCTYASAIAANWLGASTSRTPSAARGGISRRRSATASRLEAATARRLTSGSSTGRRRIPRRDALEVGALTFCPSSSELAKTTPILMDPRP